MHVYVCSNHEKKNLILYLSTLPRCTGYHSVYCRSAAYSCDIEVSEYTVDNKDSFILSTTVCFVCVCVLTNRTSHTTPSVDRGLYRFRPHGNFCGYIKKYKYINTRTYTHMTYVQSESECVRIDHIPQVKRLQQCDREQLHSITSRRHKDTQRVTTCLCLYRA